MARGDGAGDQRNAGRATVLSRTEPAQNRACREEIIEDDLPFGIQGLPVGINRNAAGEKWLPFRDAGPRGLRQTLRIQDSAVQEDRQIEQRLLPAAATLDAPAEVFSGRQQIRPRLELEALIAPMNV